MDEVDKIIIHSLRHIGCHIDDEVSSLSSFTPELLVVTVAACLQEINPTTAANLPKKLPDGMTQRFAAASNLAESCAAAGYRNDIGYQTFLYPNVVDVRKLFMFLIEMLPKERVAEADDTDTSTDGNELARLEREIKHNILQSLHAPWVPAYCRTHMNRRHEANIIVQSYIDFKPHLNLYVASEGVTQSGTASEMQMQTINIFQQIAKGDYDVISTALHNNDMELYGPQIDYEQYNDLIVSASNTHIFSNTIPINNNINQEAATKSSCSRKTPLQELSDQIDAFKCEQEQLSAQRKAHNAKINESNSLQATLQTTIAKLRKSLKMHERSCVVLQQPNENVEKLKAMLASSHAKRLTLQQQWQNYRQPLEQQLQTLQNERLTTNISKSSKDVQTKIAQLERNIEEKSAAHAQLSAELKRCNVRSPTAAAAAPRKEYTRRIMEFISNIRKQRADVYRVLDDTRDLQKQINTVSAQLQRQFNFTDDLLFQSAAHDAHSRRAYKLLAALHAACNELVTLVTQTGHVGKDIRDLEESIDGERSQNVVVNLERILSDIRNFEDVIQRLECDINEIEAKRNMQG